MIRIKPSEVNDTIREVMRVTKLVTQSSGILSPIPSRKKRGRPPIFGKAMTGAERKRRHVTAFHKKEEREGRSPPGFYAWLCRADRIPTPDTIFIDRDGQQWRLSTELRWERYDV